MKDRIRQIMEAQHMNQQAFANFTNIATASLSNIFSERTRPTLMHVEALMHAFPKLNLQWLLSGEGQMFNDSDPESAASPTPSENRAYASEQDLFSNNENMGSQGAAPNDQSAAMGDLFSSQGGQFPDQPAQFANQGAQYASHGAQYANQANGRAYGSETNGGAGSSAGRSDNLRNTDKMSASRPTPHHGSSANGGRNEIGQNFGRQQIVAIPAPSQRKITEIRVYYDDQTWESFTPKNK